MEMLSVEQVADELGLHVRTVRTYIREGRLNAVRIGKQYRITRADLEAMTGAPPPVAARRAEAATTVRVDGIGRSDMDRISTLLTASTARGEGVRIQISYDEDNASLTVMLLGGLAATAELLRLVHVLTDQEGRGP
ncbi:helix-turn-helix domain-containing protein [Actinokineospora auranticolor]|uniref:helix-turn-helix domain-containing protein n=1 Tax=Actinokineospora auranticolor TaxID=155976 RepID=UPI000CEB847D|nr:helix-turn-helix domain-containing protein [Actinokineospora auranticolor]